MLKEQKKTLVKEESKVNKVIIQQPKKQEVKPVVKK